MEMQFNWTDELANKWAIEQMFMTRLTLDEFKAKNSPLPQPILTTEEGDKKYKGDEVWWVEPSSMGNYNMGKFVITGDAIAKYYKYFSTEIAAKGYQLLARLRSLHEQGLKYINEYNK